VKARNISATHEHEWEAAPGLPSSLPADEHVVWQGSPDWKQLALHAFHVRKIAVYFVVMIGIQFVNLLGEGQAGRELFVPVIVSLCLASLALGLLTLCAWFTGRSALYTLTNKRIVMRIGIVLTLTFNLPYRRIAAASLKPCQQGCADIALQLYSEDRIGWAHLWPHQKAWHVQHPQPTLRCVPNGQEVGELLMRLWREHHAGESVRMGEMAQSTSQREHTPEGAMA